MKALKLLFFTSFLALTPAVVANTDDWYGEVNQILVDDQFYGGCMAQISPTPSSRQGINCPTDWVSFNCLNESKEGYEPPGKAAGQAKLSSAQLALVARKRIKIFVRDDVKFNGHCLGTAVNNTNNNANP